jgi:hypothetical protein
MDKSISEKENTKTREPKIEDSLRLTVSKTADKALATVVDRVNEGFTGGRVNRVQMASWILAKFSESLSNADIRTIRADHYDAVAALESAFRRAKETGVVPDELRLLLQKNEGLDETPKKKSKKSLQENIPNGDIPNEDTVN